MNTSNNIYFSYKQKLAFIKQLDILVASIHFFIQSNAFNINPHINSNANDPEDIF